MAELIALKNRATAAINGEVSSDGLSAMLGDEGDLQSMLIESVKKGGAILKGSAEDWISQTSDRARELLNNIGKKKEKPTLPMQFEKWMNATVSGEVTKRQMMASHEDILENITNGLIQGFSVRNGNVLEVDIEEAFGLDPAFISGGAMLYHLTKPQQQAKHAHEPIVEKKTEDKTKHESQPVINLVEVKSNKTKRKSNRREKTSENQLTFDLFA